ncbi:MAG: toprim domain-containing protein [Caldilineaceae bacterium]|nr:toprim domain-containing protein [Caldilineaceae bacterium]
MVELAKRYTSLQQISRAGEYAGPCPRCGGEDRFHIKDNRFYCRQCYPRGGDVIDLVQLIENVSFREACQILATDLPFFSERQSAHSSRQEKSHHADTLSPIEQTEAFFESARKTVAATNRRLFSADGGAGREYLQQRGLLETTWRTFRLGYGTTFHPLHQRNEPAIFIPWLSADDQRVEALRHRFIDPKLPKQERYSLKPGSHTVIFGLHTLRPAQHLTVVEGEFNCMALHQVGLATVSLGSQTGAQQQATLERLIELLPQYKTVTIWLDDLHQGQRLADRIIKAEPFRKEKVQVLASHSYDANDLLRKAELLAYLASHGITPHTEQL